MEDSFECRVRRIDFEPKNDYLEVRTYAHVFLKSLDGTNEIDVYTDNPRFEAAFLTAFSSDPTENRYIKVHYEVIEETKTKRVVRVILDQEFVVA